ncbi:MAG: prolipoprotein diacylglyceryl transferase [Microbacteriaceae bacterium]
MPSPDVNKIEFELPFFGTLQIYFYGMVIMMGMIAAVLITNYRLTKKGVEPWLIIDVGVLWAIPFGIVGARIYHVLSHPGDYFFEGANPMEIFAVWNGGIAIFGALIGGAIGAWIGCKFAGLRFFTFVDALAPGLLLAQAIGRFGNYFNNELFGQPTDLPWGLEISPDNPAFPVGLPADTLFHPTFLYESVWNVLGVIAMLMLEKRLRLQWGRVFAIYLIWYGLGRTVFESIRLDPSEVFLGIRTNVWGALFAIALGLAIYFVQKHRHPGVENSPYVTKPKYADWPVEETGEESADASVVTSDDEEDQEAESATSHKTV